MSYRSQQSSSGVIQPKRKVSGRARQFLTAETLSGLHLELVKSKPWISSRTDQRYQAGSNRQIPDGGGGHCLMPHGDRTRNGRQGLFSGPKNRCIDRNEQGVYSACGIRSAFTADNFAG